VRDVVVEQGRQAQTGTANREGTVRTGWRDLTDGANARHMTALTRWWRRRTAVRAWAVRALVPFTRRTSRTLVTGCTCVGQGLDRPLRRNAVREVAREAPRPRSEEGVPRTRRPERLQGVSRSRSVLGAMGTRANTGGNSAAPAGPSLRVMPHESAAHVLIR
jgi:hypothetical protein